MPCLEGSCAHDLGQRFLEFPQRRVPRRYGGQPLDDRSEWLADDARAAGFGRPSFLISVPPLCHDVPVDGNLFLEES